MAGKRVVGLQLLQVVQHHVRDVPACEVLPDDAFLFGQAILDRDHAGDISPAFDDQALVAASRLEGHQGLDQTVELGHVERLDHQFDHLFLGL